MCIFLLLFSILHAVQRRAMYRKCYLKCPRNSTIGNGVVPAIFQGNCVRRIPAKKKEFFPNKFVRFIFQFAFSYLSIVIRLSFNKSLFLFNSTLDVTTANYNFYSKRKSFALGPSRIHEISAPPVSQHFRTMAPLTC